MDGNDLACDLRDDRDRLQRHDASVVFAHLDMLDRLGGGGANDHWRHGALAKRATGADCRRRGGHE